MAKGYPASQESTVLPECAICGSRLFREVRDGLQCEDCDTVMRDPFTAPR